MKKRLIAVLLVLTMAICAFPASAFADNASVSPMSVTGRITFADRLGNEYPVETSTIVSTTTNSSYTGYVIVIQEVLYRYYLRTGNVNFNPQGVDGVFGNNTRLAVVSFQVATMGESQADGVVGPNTWAKLHYVWESILGSPNLTYLSQ